MRIKMVLGVLFLVGASGCAFAASDFQFTLNNTSGIPPNWSLTSISDPSLFGGSLPASNPTINLVVGKRYGVTVVNSSLHIFEVLAMGSTFATDTVLLAADGETGTFQSDPDVNWTDNHAASNELSEFTLTPALFAAMQTAGHAPGFRCGIHIMDMRGGFAVTQGSGPTITTQPTSLTVNVGDPASFTVAATGTAPLSYQWMQNGGDIAGATLSTYNIAAAQTSDAGTYTCMVSDTTGNVTSNPATLTVNSGGTLPTVTTQPISQTVNVGDPVSFTVAATGTGPLSYQWLQNGGTITGATLATYTIASAQPTDAATYTCTVSNAGGSVTSNPATLTVNQPGTAPVFTLQPVSQTAAVGASASFTVDATGTTPITFQWQRNGAAVAGASDTTYTVVSAQLSDNGVYTCLAINSGGSATSNPATLTVIPPPTPPIVTTQPVSQSVNVGAPVRFLIVASGSLPLSYQWQRNSGNILGATDAIYDIASAQTTDAGIYTCTVTNAGGSATSDPATLSVSTAPTAPVITVQPVSQTVDQGAAASFSVAATGTEPLSYQWMLNGGNIGNATRAAYSIGTAQASDAGSYACMVSNAGGSTMSNPATLTVNAPATAPSITAQPVSQTVNQGAPANFAIGATGTPPLSYQWQKDGGSLAGGTDSIFTIAAAQASDAGSYACLVSNAAGSAMSSAATLTVTPAGVPVITTQPLTQTANPGAAVSLTVAAAGTPPLSYQWLKNGVDLLGAIAAIYNIYPVQLADAGDYACTVTNTIGSATSDAAALTVAGGPTPPLITTQPVSITANPGASASFSVTASGTPPLSYQWLKNGVDILGATAAIYPIASVQPSDAGSFACVVTNSAGLVQSHAAALTVSAIFPPVITQQPASLTVNPGQPASFSVAATGTAPLSYQWMKNGSAVAGATVSAFSIASAQPTDAGSFSCRVSNAAGSATSDPATLTVAALVPPTITTQPVSQTVSPGAHVSFIVGASGTPPLSYQWLKDGLNIVGAAAAIYTIPAARTSDAGGYACVVSNVAGSATSNPATLTVGAPPVVITQPASQTVNPGTPVSFTVVASGTPPLLYQWLKNGSAVAGATASSFNIVSAQSTDAGNYSCRVSNAAGAVSSNAATLNVNGPPAIITQPVSQTVNQGGSANFTVAASGTAPLSYQWQKNGGNIAGATLSTYHIASVQVSDAASYLCIVSNIAGSVTSNAATLTVNTPPLITVQPVSLTVSSGAAATFTLAATGTLPLSYQWQKNGASIGGATLTAYSIASAQATDAGNYACVVSNAVGSVTSDTATLTVNTSPAITTQPVSLTVNQGSAANFAVAATGSTPLSYQWQKNGADIGGATLTTYSIAAVQATDAGNYACMVSNSVGSVTSNPATLTVNAPPVITTQPVSVTVNQGGSANFVIAATGTPPVSYQWQKNGANIVGATSTAYNIVSAQATDAGSYACVVSNVAGSVTSNAATLTVNAPPVVTTQPVSQTVFPGASVTFSVAAAGTPPLSYQWRKNTSDIASATTSSYTIGSAQLTDAGNYSCLVTNPLGSVTSDTATLSVNSGVPVITTQPASKTVNASTVVSFTLVASGAPPLSYQWQKGTADISGATSATYTIVSAQTSDGGAYQCVVSNAFGSATSEPATLTLNCTPPVAPADVQASKGTFEDRVQVTWNPVTGATAYKVFRDASATSAQPQFLDTVTPSRTAYDDVTAQPPTQAMASGPLGCFEHTRPAPVKYFYFVEAVNTCGESPLSTPSQGWRGNKGCDDKSVAATTRETVLPARLLNDTTRAIQSNSSLFVRLQSGDAIDVSSIWGTISASDRTSQAVSWLPVGSSDVDGWVVFVPEQPWIVDDVVTMTIGAKTVTGYEIGPITYKFQVESAGASADAGVAVAQPDYAALNVSGLDPAKENNGEVMVTQIDTQLAPPLADRIGPLYALGPEAAYATPQRVWVPLPAGADANAVELYYYHGTGPDPGWYPAENVEGWLVPDSYLTVDIGGIRYFGFAVRHSGIVQLVEPGYSEPAAPAAASAIPWDPANAAGDVLTVIVLMTAMLFAGKVLNRTRRTVK